MSFDAANRARAHTRLQSPAKLVEQVTRHERERRTLIEERDVAILLLRACHHDGTSTSDALGRPESVWLTRGAAKLSLKIRWGSDGVPRIGPKARAALTEWFHVQASPEAP